LGAAPRVQGILATAALSELKASLLRIGGIDVPDQPVVAATGVLRKIEGSPLEDVVAPDQRSLPPRPCRL
jgi:hypothetical protein